MTNPKLSPFLNIMSMVHAAVLAISSFGLIFLPAVTAPLWPWETTPFNLRFIGAIYVGALANLLPFALKNHWSPGRVVLVKTIAFSSLLVAMTAMHWSEFRQNWGTWVWVPLIVAITANAAYHLWRYRSLPPVDAAPPPSPLRLFLWVMGGLVTLYALAMLFAPAAATGFWPWPVNDLHSRMYSGMFLAYGLGSLVLARGSSADERRAAGIGHTVWGAASIGALLLVDSELHRVNWSAPGTWVWIIAFVLIALGGVGLIAAARPVQRAASVPI